MSDKLDLGALLRKQQEDFQGYVLDFARVSSMGDRQFQQFEKSIKRYFRSSTDALISVLKEYIESKRELEVSERPSIDGRSGH